MCCMSVAECHSMLKRIGDVADRCRKRTCGCSDTSQNAYPYAETASIICWKRIVFFGQLLPQTGARLEEKCRKAVSPRHYTISGLVKNGSASVRSLEESSSLDIQTSFHSEHFPKSLQRMTHQLMFSTFAPRLGRHQFLDLQGCMEQQGSDVWSREGFQSNSSSTYFDYSWLLELWRLKWRRFVRTAFGPILRTPIFFHFFTPHYFGVPQNQFKKEVKVVYIIFPSLTGRVVNHFFHIKQMTSDHLNFFLDSELRPTSVLHSPGKKVGGHHDVYQ